MMSSVTMMQVASAVAWQLGGCGAGRVADVFRGPPRRIPADAASVTGEWVRANLAASLALDPAEIVEVAIEQIGSQTTARCIAHVRYRSDGGARPARLFVKARPANKAIGVFGALFELGHKEVRFYREIQATLPVETPVAYIARSRRVGGDFVLALEDLSARSAVFKTVRDECSLEEAERVVDALAALHARYWNRPELDADLGWLESSRMERKQAINAVLKSVACKKVFSSYSGILPADVLGSQALLASADAKVFDHNETLPRTFLHGDPHLGNLYFVDGKVGFLDWQVIQKGCGIKDLAYFLIVSLPCDLRRQHDLRLVARYVERLNTLGVGLDEQEAIHAYRLNSIHPFLAAVVTAAAGDMQTAAVIERSLMKTATAISDLGLIGLARGLG